MFMKNLLILYCFLNQNNVGLLSWVVDKIILAPSIFSLFYLETFVICACQAKTVASYCPTIPTFFLQTKLKQTSTKTSF